MIFATGKTFPHRERLKRLGGSWNNDASRWEFYALTATEIAELRSFVGVVVFEEPTEQPKPSRSEQILEIIFGLREEIDDEESSTRTTKLYGDDPTYFNYFKFKNPLAFFGFSSLQTFIDHVENGKQIGSGWKNDTDWKWYGTRDMPEALKLARGVWQEGLDNAEEIIELLNIEHATKRRRSFNVAGGSVSVGRMLAGNPRHMTQRPKLEGKRIVTLFIEGFMSAGIEPENAIARGAIVAAIADIMEREGYSCEIVSIFTTADPGQQSAITLKRAGDPLNLPDVIFALSHPSFFRRFVFAAVSNSPECRPIHNTQGFPSTAFDDKHPTGKNEFYIRKLALGQQDKINDESLKSRVLSMLRFVEPKNLPIRIRNDDRSDD